MIKLASLLIVHHIVTNSVVPIPYQYQFVMTNNQPSQYTRLMLLTTLNGQQVQFNEPDGSTGYRDGTNYYIYSSKLSNFPNWFFTTKPSP